MRDSLDDLLLTPADMYFTTGEVAIVLGVGASTVKRWEAAGRLACLKNLRGVRYFRAGDVFALRNAREEACESAPSDGQVP